jgi:homoserine dehydrogenase
LVKEKIKIGIVGFGTVGAGVAKLVLENGKDIAEKNGVEIEIASIVDLDTETPRPVKLPDGILTNDIKSITENEDIQIAIELVGGTTAAKDIQIQMLKAGKNVITANKALLAEHGTELYRCAAENNRCIAFEASCGGGIPIVSGIRTGLAANKIDSMYGILNGTSNYILTQMTDKGESFENALVQAQEKGFAEADPTLDINGCDSAHKLVILSSIALGYSFSMDDITYEGIEDISEKDIRFGSEMGYVLKLLAIAERRENGKISLRVHPSFIAKENTLAKISGSFNGVSVFGSAVGEVIYYGRGAGMLPTASAVVADIIDTALGNAQSKFEHLNLKPHKETEKIVEKIDELVSRFYIRLMVKDEPGVFAEIGRILADNQISISGILQHEGRGPENTIPVVITTHPTKQSKITSALKESSKVEQNHGKPVCIRIVDIQEDTD